jgi:hypothetical protein
MFSMQSPLEMFHHRTIKRLFRTLQKSWKIVGISCSTASSRLFNFWLCR